MKRQFPAFLSIVASLGFLSTSLHATTSGTAGFSFLNLPVGARATAMGEAFSSVPNDIQGLVYNPACLATMAASQLSFQHLTYVDSVNQEAFSFGHAGRQEEMSWGVSANYLSVADITRTVATGQVGGDGFTEQGTFSTYDMALGLSAAGPVAEDLKAGGTVKFIHESLADASSSAGAVDAGVTYRLSDEHSWNVAASVLNFGLASKFADAAVKLPWTFRAGLSGQPFAQWLLSTDYVKRVDTSGEFDVGAEVTPRRFFSLRVGYRYALTRPELGGLSDFSAGVGLRYHHMVFDYAFIPLGDLGITHRITVSYRFKPKPD
jgi:long-subunit fatty acid transport protein